MFNAALMIVPSVVIVGFCFAFSGGLAEAQGTESTPTGALAADNVYLWVSIVQAVVTIIAIMLGGIFAWRRGFIFRHWQPHVTISHDVTHRQVSPENVHVEITAILHNSSQVKVEFRDGLFTVEQLAPVSDEYVEQLYGKTFVDKERYEAPEWHCLKEVRLEWEEDELIAEPGEKVAVTLEYIVPNYVESVLITTYFYNTRVMRKIPAEMNPRDAKRKKRRWWFWQTSGPRGWIRTTAHDIVLPGGNQNLKENGR